MKILVLTTEPLPLPGLVTTGAGLRAWHLARGLESAGFEVEAAMPDDAVGALDEERRAAVEAHCFSRRRLSEFVRERAPDIVVMQHWGLVRDLGAVDRPLAIDLAGPHLLERRFWGSRSPERDRAEKIEALGKADFVTCSGRSQRFYFLPYLELAGFDPTAPELCPVIPFSADPEQPPERGRDPACFVYGGMFLPWQDPSAALETLLEEFDLRERGRLRFFGGPHPSLDVSRGRFERILRRLEAHDSVEMSGLLPFDRLVEQYTRSGVALDLMARNAERELAFPTRTVIYLWCGLPVIHSDYTDLAPWIERYDAGWVLDPSDTEGLRKVIGSILERPEIVREKSRNARRLVAERLAWDRTIGPLAEWCRDPKVRQTKPALSLRDAARERRIRELEEELGAVRRELDALKGKLIFRLARKRRLWGPVLAPLAFLATLPIAAFLFVALLLTSGRKKGGSGSRR